MDEPIEDNLYRFGRCQTIRLDSESKDPEDDREDPIIGFHFVSPVCSLRVRTD